MKHKNSFDTQRRNLLRLGACGSAYGLLAPFMGGFAFAREMLAQNRILVVLELSGGNDGLNTVVPFRNDNYYKLRPNLKLNENSLRKIDGDYGLNTHMAGLEKLYKDGRMAIIHGVGYPQLLSPTSTPWPFGIRQHPIAALLTAGSGGLLMCCYQRERPTQSSISMQLNR